MRIWMTGATGQIGSTLVSLLQDRHHEVWSLGRQSSVPDDRLPRIPWSAEGEWSMPSDVSLPDAIIHLAAQTSAYVARESPATDLMVNVVAPVRLLQHVVDRGAHPYVVMAGAATQRDDSLGTDAAITFYETGKSTLELYLAQFMREGSIDFTSLRLSNVYGGMNRGRAQRGFINESVRRALGGSSLTYYTGYTCIRDFLHVTDAAEAFAVALEHRGDLAGRSFDVGSGHRHSIREALEIIADEAQVATGVGVEILGTPAPAGTYAVELQDRFVDSTDFQERTGWTATITLRNGVRRMIHEALTSR